MSGLDIECNHRGDKLRLPCCYHPCCRICFFEKIQKDANGFCKKCDFLFTSDNFKDVADKGDHDACYIVGYMYHTGKGLKQDFKLAEKYYMASVYEPEECTPLYM